MKINITNLNYDNTKSSIPGYKALTHGTDHRQMKNFAAEAEAFLKEKDLPKKLWKDTMVTFQSGAPCPSSYKYSRACHYVRLIRGIKDWFLVSIIRTDQSPTEGHDFKIHLTQQQKVELIQRVEAQFSVYDPNQWAKVRKPRGQRIYENRKAA